MAYRLVMCPFKLVNCYMLVSNQTWIDDRRCFFQAMAFRHLEVDVSLVRADFFRESMLEMLDASWHRLRTIQPWVYEGGQECLVQKANNDQ